MYATMNNAMILIETSISGYLILDAIRYTPYILMRMFIR